MRSLYTLQTTVANQIRVRFFDSMQCPNHSHLLRTFVVPKQKQSRWGKGKVHLSESERNISPFSQFDEDLSFADPRGVGATLNASKSSPPACPVATPISSTATAQTDGSLNGEQEAHKTVVLLHGFPELWWSWKYQLESLTRAGYRVIALDLRGCGGSECPESPMSYDAFSASNDVLHLLRYLGVTKASLVAHGIGSEVAHFIALYAPNYVDSITSLNYAYVAPREKNTLAYREEAVGPMFDFVLSNIETAAELEYELHAETLFRRLFAHSGVSCATPKVLSPYKHACSTIIDRLGDPLCLPHYFDEADLAYYLENYRRTGFFGAVNYFRNLDANFTRFLSLKSHVVSQPALVMFGENDILCRMPTKYRAEAYKSASVISVPDGGPFLQLQQSALVDKHLLPFLRANATIGEPVE